MVVVRPKDHVKKMNKYNILIDKNQNQKSDHGIFVFKPLKKGYGITLGNSLRRVLFSSIIGHSVFAIKVEGANHEFQVLKGVRESISELILNLKKVVIKIDQDIFGLQEQNETPFAKWPTLKLHVKKPGLVVAGDIQTPAGFEIVNKSVYLATLEKDGELEIAIYARTGSSFISFEENKDFVNEINLIATDSKFSPILRVLPKVSEYKTKKNEISDILELEVATNGSISAAEAVAMAAKILAEHYEIIAQELHHDHARIQTINEDIVAQSRQVRNTLSSSIDELDLSVRSYNCLKRAGIHTIIQLIDKTSAEVEKIRNLGRKSFKEIVNKINERNLKFKGEK